MRFKKSKKFTYIGRNEYVNRQRILKSNSCCSQCGFTARTGRNNRYYNSTTLCPKCDIELLDMGFNYRTPSKKRRKRFLKHIKNVQKYGITLLK